MFRTIRILGLGIVVLFPSFASAQSVNLNMVSVGVNRYRQPGMDLRFSAPDAQEMAATVRSNRLFARKDVNLLINEQATAQNIFNALSLLEQRASASTYSILYVSGHGWRDNNGHFHYCPHDFDSRRQTASSVAGEAIFARLKRMPGRVFFIIDACHSGATGWTRTHLINPVSTNQTVVISSSLAREQSLELGDFRNGAFTQAFMEAISGAGDANRNGTITLQEMHNYVYLRVAQITQNKQHVITFVPTVALGNMTLAASNPGFTTTTVASAGVWSGRETLRGYGALRFAFESNGRVTMTDAKSTAVGTWTRQGDVLTLRFANGRVVYTGRIAGTSFSGNAANGQTRWTFALSRGY